jgi:hypothetical protein
MESKRSSRIQPNVDFKRNYHPKESQENGGPLTFFCLLFEILFPVIGIIVLFQLWPPSSFIIGFYLGWDKGNCNFFTLTFAVFNSRNGGIIFIGLGVVFAKSWLENNNRLANLKPEVVVIVPVTNGIDNGKFRVRERHSRQLGKIVEEKDSGKLEQEKKSREEKDSGKLEQGEKSREEKDSGKLEQGEKSREEKEELKEPDSDSLQLDTPRHLKRRVIVIIDSKKKD